MPLDQPLPLLTSLVATGVAILLAGIPWAYGIHGRLTTIETALKENLPRRHAWQEFERRIARLELAAKP
ncbi:MAG: hypothetical protein WEH44_07080 [Pirellulaceae bacterium]